MPETIPIDQIPDDWADWSTPYDRMTAGRPTKYPWDEWLDGEHVYVLERGVDYQCQTASLVAQFQRRARARGLEPRWAFKVKDRFGRPGETIAIWVTRPAEPDPED